MDKHVYFKRLKEKRKRKDEKEKLIKRECVNRKSFFVLDDSTDGVRDLTIISIFEFL